MLLGGSIFSARKTRNFQYPSKQFCKADAVYFTLIHLVAEAIVKGHGDVFVIGPAEGKVVEIFETQEIII